MRMGQGVRTGLGHGGITCVLQTQFSSFFFFFFFFAGKLREAFALQKPLTFFLQKLAKFLCLNMLRVICIP